MPATTLYEAWDHRWLGAATLTFTDNTGSYPITIDSTTLPVAGITGRDEGMFSHIALTAIDPKDRRGALIDLGFGSFATKLQALMDAATIRTITVSFSQTTLLYTLAASGGNTFLNLAFSGAAGDRMRRILGFAANVGDSNTASWASTMRPWYLWRPAVDGRAAYDPYRVVDGARHAHRADDATVYTYGPVMKPRTGKWEHRFETRAAIERRAADLDTTVSGVSWSFEDFVEHAADYPVPCVIADSTESAVFFPTHGFDRDSSGRSRPDADTHLWARLRPDSVLGYL